MGKKLYLLNEDKNERLLLKWRPSWAPLQIYFNEQLIGQVNAKYELKEGLEFALPNGKTLFVRLEGSFFPALITKIDGKHIEGSMGDPSYQLKQIFLMLLVLGIINIVAGLILFSLIIDDANSYYALTAVAFGIFQIGFGYGIRKGILLCQILASIVMAVDLVAMIAITTKGNSDMQVGIIIKATFLLLIMKGFRYIREFQKIKQGL